jgi:hypothetical protein
VIGAGDTRLRNHKLLKAVEVSGAGRRVRSCKVKLVNVFKAADRGGSLQLFVSRRLLKQHCRHGRSLEQQQSRKAHAEKSREQDRAVTCHGTEVNRLVRTIPEMVGVDGRKEDSYTNRGRTIGK